MISVHSLVRLFSESEGKEMLMLHLRTADAVIAKFKVQYSPLKSTSELSTLLE